METPQIRWTAENAALQNSEYGETVKTMQIGPNCENLHTQTTANTTELKKTNSNTEKLKKQQKLRKHAKTMQINCEDTASIVKLCENAARATATLKRLEPKCLWMMLRRF